MNTCRQILTKQGLKPRQSHSTHTHRNNLAPSASVTPISCPDPFCNLGLRDMERWI